MKYTQYNARYPDTQLAECQKLYDNIEKPHDKYDHEDLPLALQLKIEREHKLIFGEDK